MLATFLYLYQLCNKITIYNVVLETNIKNYYS